MTDPIMLIDIESCDLRLSQVMAVLDTLCEGGWDLWMDGDRGAWMGVPPQGARV